RLDLPAATAWGVDLPDVTRDEQRREEWESLNMIPMGVRDEEMTLDRTGARRRQGTPELIRAGATIEHHEGTVGGAHFHTGGVAPIAQGRRPGHRDGSTGAPETNTHGKHLPCFPDPRSAGSAGHNKHVRVARWTIAGRGLCVKCNTSSCLYP